MKLTRAILSFQLSHKLDELVEAHVKEQNPNCTDLDIAQAKHLALKVSRLVLDEVYDNADTPLQ
jgi:hypothetical protein